MVRAMPLVRWRGGRESELWRTLHGLVAVLCALVAMGCYRVPAGKRAVDEVVIQGTREIDVDELYDRIATRESSRFLGIFEGVAFDYEIFDPFALRRDLERIERYLRARGYY